MVEFHALGSGGSPPYQYDWTFGDGSRVAGRDQNHTFFEPGTWMVQVTARDARGQLDADRSPISIVANPKTTTDLLLPGIVGFQTLLIVALLFLVGKKRRAVQTVRSEEASEKIEDVPAPDTGSPRPSDAPEVAKPETSAAANEPAAPASEDRTQGPPA
jgi:PKD repeat protein